MSLNIEIKTIPRNQQRYDTVGDWYLEDGVFKFRISDMGNEKMEALIAIHELVEAVLCYGKGINQHDVDEFDLRFEKESQPGGPKENAGEPGDDPDSPYQFPHAIGTGIERILCACLGIKWADYEKVVNSL